MQNYACDKDTHCINKLVTARIGYALLTVPETIENVFKTVFGVTTGALNLATMGTSRYLKYYTRNSLKNGSQKLISSPYKTVVHLLNPQAKFQDKAPCDAYKVFERIQHCNAKEAAESGRYYTREKNPFEPLTEKPLLVYCDGDGLINDFFSSRLKEYAYDCTARSNHWLTRHVFSRLTHVLALVVNIVCRVIDLAIGAIAAIFSIFPCFGRCETLNNMAYRGLQFPGLIHDIFNHLTCILNPKAFY